MKKLLLLLVLITSNSFAEDRWHESKISAVYPTSGGTFVIKFEGDSVHCQSTATPHYYYVEVGKNQVTDEGSNKMYSAVLSAGMTGKRVSINFDDSTPQCYVNRLLVFF